MPKRTDGVDAMLEQWRKERPDLDSTGMGIVLRILFLAGLMGERLKKTLEPSGLAPWEFDVLSALRRSEASEGLSPSELCEFAQLSSGAMTNRIDRLEESKLVRRSFEVEDRRSLRVKLTARGKALIDRVIGDRMEDALESVSTLSQKDQRILAGLLRTLVLEQ